MKKSYFSDFISTVIFAPSWFGSEVLVARADFMLVKLFKAHLLTLGFVSISASNSWFPFLR
jgi:hypothetical protein